MGCSRDGLEEGEERMQNRGMEISREQSGKPQTQRIKDHTSGRISRKRKTLITLISGELRKGQP